MNAETVIDLKTWLRRRGRAPDGVGRNGLRGSAGGGSPAGPDKEHWLVMNLHRAGLLRDWYAGSGELGKWRAVSDRISEALQHGLSYVCVEPSLDTGDAVGFTDLLQNATELYQRQVAADFE